MVTDEVVLVDQHCHGVVAGELGGGEVAAWLTEAEGVPEHRDPFESMIGLAVRRWCGPVLGLPELVGREGYLARRAELGWREVTRRLLDAAGVGTWLVDTGFVPQPAESGDSRAGGGDSPAGGGDSRAGGGDSRGLLGVEREVVRVEGVAEEVAGWGGSVGGLVGAIREELWGRARRAVGLKTIVGYRWGLGVPGEGPAEGEVVHAAERWVRGGRGKLTEPALLHWLVHEAARVGAELGLPVQVHTGFGDADLRLRDVDPALLTDLIRKHPRTTFVLLHCWPYHRNAAYLAHVYGNVVVDIGLMVPFVGARAGDVLAEVLELAPFDAVVYSSDGRALPETHCLGAKLFRHHCGRLLDTWIGDRVLTAADAERLAHGIGAGNAQRVYQLT